MTKLEREKYLLALNDAQRIAFLFTLSNFLRGTDAISKEEFEEILRLYQPKEKVRHGELTPLNVISIRPRGPGRHHQEGR